jgi:hypothetical protein
LTSELNKKYTVNYGATKEETKTLAHDWLQRCESTRLLNIKTKEGKTVAALSKDVLN